MDNRPNVHYTTAFKYRQFLASGKMVWDHKEWSEFQELLLDIISRRTDLDRSLYSVEIERVVGQRLDTKENCPLQGLPYCYLFKGNFLPSKDKDGIFWKPSRGTIKVGRSLCRRYHYAQYKGHKLRRQVSFLHPESEWAFIEYAQGSTNSPINSDHIFVPEGQHFTNLIQLVAEKFSTEGDQQPQNNGFATDVYRPPPQNTSTYSVPAQILPPAFVPTDFHHFHSEPAPFQMTPMRPNFNSLEYMQPPISNNYLYSEVAHSHNQSLPSFHPEMLPMITNRQERNEQGKRTYDAFSMQHPWVNYYNLPDKRT